MSFGKWLKDQRVSLNLSQQDFAKMTGIHQVSISGLENGTRKPHFKTVAKLSDFLGISVMDIQRVISRTEDK